MARIDEGWILAGTIDGELATPAPLEPVAGVPHLLRCALSLKAAGASRIAVIWLGGTEPPAIDELAADRRLGGVPMTMVTTAPSGGADDPVVVCRADRVYHRDLPRRVSESEPLPPHGARVIEDRAIDAVAAAPRAVAARIASAAPRAGGIAGVFDQLERDGNLATTFAPWCGFSMAVRNRADHRRAEWRLCWTLRKLADGFAAQLINRRISLPITFLLCRTRILPNQVTVLCLLSALAGGLFIARGGYTNGVIGMILFELGSILDGIDGELSRLKYQGSRLGQWMDTVTDDISNVFFGAGTTLSLHAAGVGWAASAGLAGLVCFFATQLTQYYYLVRYYDSGDLADNPWAMQGGPLYDPHDRRTAFRKFLSMTPRLFKRDFFITLFLALAIADRLEVALAIFAGGAVSFFFVFFFQLARHRMRSPRPAV
jgi:phosphatidylglycerophosphate synthase